jgi:hypothetical protein
MKINNVELEDIDILDADVAETYENALATIDGIAEKVEGMKSSESIRTQCTAIFGVFNSLFGPGTDKKVFGEKVNLLICLKAFEELVTTLNSRTEEVQKLSNKYSPNRAQKRAKK